MFLVLPINNTPFFEKQQQQKEETTQITCFWDKQQKYQLKTKVTVSGFSGKERKQQTRPSNRMFPTIPPRQQQCHACTRKRQPREPTDSANVGGCPEQQTRLIKTTCDSSFKRNIYIDHGYEPRQVSAVRQPREPRDSAATSTRCREKPICF